MAEDSDISCCDFAANDGCGADIDCSACPGANGCGYLHGWYVSDTVDYRPQTSSGGTPTQLNDNARLRPREMGYQQDYGFWMNGNPDDCNRAYVIMGVCAPDGTCDNCCGTPTLRLFYHNGAKCVEMTFHPQWRHLPEPAVAAGPAALSAAAVAAAAALAAALAFALPADEPGRHGRGGLYERARRAPPAQLVHQCA